jgi:hypothetical protein
LNREGNIAIADTNSDVHSNGDVHSLTALQLRCPD